MNCAYTRIHKRTNRFADEITPAADGFVRKFKQWIEHV